MKQLVRCKACGYIMAEDKVRDKCPACGVPSKAFEPYKDTMSEKRRKLISLDLHPVAVHFPQAFSALIPLIILASMVLGPEYSMWLISSVKLLIYILPFSMLLALATGLLDGKTRFKKLKNILLLRKLFLGTVFLVLSVIMAAVVYMNGLDDNTRIIVLILSIGCVSCQTLLGLIGTSINNAYLPG